ncbi:F-box/WD-40 repeat-containing protein At5g21040 [Andrographis paniculata]|uniref:F-box/WD-40 repeat-containing protein At5g21040 n=1 Tax=Andrographis paniculata TaxID=175694 RepID=UPI0021E75C34|nr:F-box/WD-40 repeat-containing protein At5g21040 [Andrographis paniculata]XP_051143285.1 F-box/WD-40 repeat-containing protein At5g21040 [Andrographis paniculata]
MAFECQGNTEIESKDISRNHLGNLQSKKLEKRILSNKKQVESREAEIPEGVFVFNAKHGMCSFEQQEDSRSFLDLPPALISEILNFLDPRELGTVSCVNKSLYSLATEHQVWKEFYHERWGHPVASINLGPGCSNEKSWKELFVERESRSKSFKGHYSIDTLHGHTEAVRTVFVLDSKKLVFTSGYDQVVKMWDMEEGMSIASSRPLGCTIRAIAADSRHLVAGGTDGFIHGWKVEDGNPHLFDLRAQHNVNNMEFRVWEHNGPITCLALDFSKMYSGSWDMTIRVWDRSSLKCLNVLVHNDWVWSLVPHDTTIGSTAGSGVYIWDTNSGSRLGIINGPHVGNAYALARSHTGKLLFTGGEDGSIHMFEMLRNSKCNIRKIATWIPHSGPVYSLAFEFPWLVSASSDGKISLIDVRELLKRKRTTDITSKAYTFDQKNVEPPQRMLHGFGSNLFSVGIGSDRIVCGGEEGVVRIWNFSRALEIEQRDRALRGMKLEKRMRRRRLQLEMSTKGGQDEQCSVAAKKNQMNTDKSGWHGRRRVSGKLKA